MTGKERFTRILNHQPADRIGLFEHLWNDTRHRWEDEGHLKPKEDIDTHFGFDISEAWCFNPMADLDFEPVKVAEDADTVTMLDGNGATLRRHKHHDTTPEHVDFSVTCWEDWEERIKPLLKPDPRRTNFEYYRRRKREAAEAGRFFTWSGVNAFECIHPVCGHVGMLMGMADDPEWVRDMAETYARLIIDLQTMLFEQEGLPDGVWYYEDLGYKGAPFMSPAMFREIIQPSYAKTIGFAHSLGLPVIMHSCGYVEPLVPGLIEAGIDCLQVIEVKAGMDLLKLHRLYGEKIAFMGGIDVRVLSTNDRSLIDAELEAKIPIVKLGNNFVLHSDHSIPRTVDYETYRYFIDKGLSL